MTNTPTEQKPEPEFWSFLMSTPVLFLLNYDVQGNVVLVKSSREGISHGVAELKILCF